MGAIILDHAVIEDNVVFNKLGKDEALNITKLLLDEFIEELKLKNSDIEVLGQYKNNYTKIKCRCKIDGHIWEVRPSDLLIKDIGCPKCNSSKGEKRISKYLDSIDLDYIHDKRYFKDLKGINDGILRPDFILENDKIWIEYDGIQHFEPIDIFDGEDGFKETKENDRIKNEYAKKHGWKLIRIPYYDFDNVEEILEKELEKVLTLNK